MTTKEKLIKIVNTEYRNNSTLIETTIRNLLRDNVNSNINRIIKIDKLVVDVEPAIRILKPVIKDTINVIQTTFGLHFDYNTFNNYSIEIEKLIIEYIIIFKFYKRDLDLVRAIPAVIDLYLRDTELTRKVVFGLLIKDLESLYLDKVNELDEVVKLIAVNSSLRFLSNTFTLVNIPYSWLREEHVSLNLLSEWGLDKSTYLSIYTIVIDKDN